MSENINKVKGYLGELEFKRLLYEHKIPFEYKDGWYDFSVDGVKVEVKTCMLTHKAIDKRLVSQAYRIGRFDFTDRQQQEEIYVAFFVRHSDEFLFMGIAKLAKDTPRYISIHKLRTLNLMTMKQFKEMLI